MGFSFSNSTIENLKNQVNIIDVVGRVVPLKRMGGNYKGVCPFHNEKTPSFVVSEQKQIFTCFGCGATGDMIEFVKRYYNLEFSEAVEKISNEYGITLEKNSYNDNRDIYYNVNKLAARFFYRNFTGAPNPGYAYMKNRGISPEVLRKFGIGYADGKGDSLFRYLVSQGIDKKVILELGLANEGRNGCYDKFRNRVIFPIINTSGRIIGFGGRAISPDDNPKYLNSPESKVFQKKNNLYGLNISRQIVGKEGFIILVEGYMDTISLFQSGIENVAASLGTALTENQAKLIKRYTKSVVLSYDADSAGINAALRGLDILRSADCNVRVLHVTDGKDPDEFVKKNGKNEFLKLIDSALPFADYKLDNAKAGLDLTNDQDKLEYIKRANVILNELRPAEQEIYIKRVSKSINVAEGAIRMELFGNDSPEKNEHIPKKDEKPKSSIISLTEKTILKVILTDEEYLLNFDEYKEILESDFASAIYRYALKSYETYGFIDIKAIMDNLSSDDANELQNILDQIIIGGNEEKVFRECVDAWQDNKLAATEQRIITLLSLADENENQDKIKELTDELISVQKKRKYR